MPVSFQYLRTSDGEPESLAVVDEAVGIPCDTRHYCGLFQSLQLTGLAIARRGDGYKTSAEGLAKFREEYPNDYEHWDLVERFTVTDYTIKFWR